MDDSRSELAKSYVPPPKKLPGFKDAKSTTPKTPMGGGKKRKRWINIDGDILEWDYQHGKIERYNNKGRHKGEFDPSDGTQTKPPKADRIVTPTTWEKGDGKMRFSLAWYDKNNDELFGEVMLPLTTSEIIQELFELEANEYTGD